ncbi:MAG: hypothetical protein IJ901_05460 [Bacteroidaceae bacterium]|nr:hypothetical protein [Bacteroidaceae bacterium]
MAALGRKKSELAKLTKEVDAVSSVIQLFRNHNVLIGGRPIPTYGAVEVLHPI